MFMFIRLKESTENTVDCTASDMNNWSIGGLETYLNELKTIRDSFLRMSDLLLSDEQSELNPVLDEIRKLEVLISERKENEAIPVKVEA